MPVRGLRITHVITRLIVGGAQENTLASVLGLRQFPEFEVDLLAGPTTGPEGSLESQASTVPGLFTRLPSLVRPIHPWHDTRAYRQLIRRFRQHRPDVVHTHSGKAGFLGRLAAHRAGVPCVIHTIHGPSFGPFQGWLPNRVFRLAERLAARHTDHFVVVAHAMRDQYLAAGIGRADQYSRIFSGFALEPYLAVQADHSRRLSFGFEPEDCVLGVISRLFALKGHDELLDITPSLLQKNPHIRLLFVGDGTWRKRLELKAESLGIGARVHFTGLVPPDDIPSMLQLMDVVVHLSRREGLPRALPQALAAGVPVVAYDCDGAAEVCLEGRTGFLVKVGDGSQLLRCILRLAGDVRLRRALGEAGRAWVRDRFGVNRMIDSLVTLYRQQAERRNHRPGLHPQRS